MIMKVTIAKIDKGLMTICRQHAWIYSNSNINHNWKTLKENKLQDLNCALTKHPKIYSDLLKSAQIRVQIFVFILYVKEGTKKQIKLLWSLFVQ